MGIFLFWIILSGFTTYFAMSGCDPTLAAFLRDEETALIFAFIALIIFSIRPSFADDTMYEVTYSDGTTSFEPGSSGLLGSAIVMVIGLLPLSWAQNVVISESPWYKVALKFIVIIGYIIMFAIMVIALIKLTLAMLKIILPLVILTCIIVAVSTSDKMGPIKYMDDTVVTVIDSQHIRVESVAKAKATVKFLNANDSAYYEKKVDLNSDGMFIFSLDKDDHMEKGHSIYVRVEKRWYDDYSDTIKLSETPARATE